jgi:hypothetical protein
LLPSNASSKMSNDTTEVVTGVDSGEGGTGFFIDGKDCMVRLHDCISSY